MKKIFILIMLAMTVLVFSSCKSDDKELLSNNSENQSVEQSDFLPLDSQKTEYIIFTRLPSPPNYKKITDKASVEKICDLINSSQKVKDDTYEDSSGWYIYLRFSDETQLTMGNTLMKVNGTAYTVDSDLQKALLEIYDNSSAEETPYNK